MFSSDLMALCADQTIPLWDGTYKIPWHDPDFSARMLEYHLTDATELASRNRQLIAEQCDWILSQLPEKCSILDLGCGPGLYAGPLTESGQVESYLGIDLGPASIRHAQSTHTQPNMQFVQGDVVEVEFPDAVDAITMIYGEFNVFSPDDVRRLLEKAHDALVPGGLLALEVQSADAVRQLADTAVSWSRESSGLFHDGPHLSLIENQWFAEQNAARQSFHIIKPDGTVSTYHNTTAAWSFEALSSLLRAAGFEHVQRQNSWPSGNPNLEMITAIAAAA